MATCKQIGDDLAIQIEDYTNFKIGKTGQTKEERFNSTYSNDYELIRVLGSSELKSVIDSCEELLIERFRDHPKCDNDQVGGGDMGESNSYKVYVVYNLV